MDIKTIFKNIILNPLLVFSKIKMVIKSFFLTRKIDIGNGKIILKSDLKVVIEKSKNSRFILDGNLKIESFLRGETPIRILLSEGSTLHIKGDFIIGNGVCLSVSENAKLIIGGKKFESESGITADSTIMAFNNIEIGNDFLCAWGVYITDSNWHFIEGQNHYKDIKIGNHVWIANNSNILKGTIINDNCIVASNSKLINKQYEENSLIAGNPAKIVRNNVVWKRDIY